jgi:hypothetical protein
VFEFLVFIFDDAEFHVMFCTDVGYTRLSESGSVRILPARLWSSPTIRPKFIIVEIQLLTETMKCNELMHQNYVAMRDKMTK